MESDGDSAGPGLAVVKVIRPSVFSEGTPDEAHRARERFGQEIDAIRAVLSPRVPALIGAVAEGQQPWLAMDYVHGPTRHRLVTGRGVLDVVPFAALGLALVDALRAIHGAKLLHRDLKPGNIVLGPRGPVVLDFGLAVLTERPSDEALTKTGSSMGTKGYTALEQLLDAKHVEAPADVYGLGATLYFAVAGKPPYDTVPLQSPPPWEGIDPRIRDILAPMLLHVPEDRPVLDVVEQRLEALLAPLGPDPEKAAEEAAEALAAIVTESGPVPVLPPEVLSEEPDPAVAERAQQAVDEGAAPDSPWAEAGAALFSELFAVTESDGDVPQEEVAPGEPSEEAAATSASEPEPAPAPAPPGPAVVTSYRIRPPRPSVPRVPAKAAPATPVPPAARKAAEQLRLACTHSGRL
ncbi:serine/threonine-protein kinase [Streptomyces sp. NBC_01579]|uniref:serine/threonine-protein kinase n=1 Tax=unclassified Streptomyces TaxID=2593676 RepID=UPI00386A38AC|nr:serine/threonine protein kinase [Streptomyces sp. NBC_01643]